MNRFRTIRSNADLEALATPNSLSELRSSGEYLKIELNRYEMHKKDLEHLIVLTSFVSHLSITQVSVSTQVLEAEVTSVIVQFANLRSLSLWWGDVFNLARIITPIPSLPASRALTSVCLANLGISTREASRISKALEYNNTLKNFKALNLRKGKSNLLPILRGSHTLDKLFLNLYYLTNMEFFALSEFFVRCKKRQKLKRLKICICPEYYTFDKTYLKFTTMIAESKVVRSLSVRTAGCNVDSSMPSMRKR